MILRSLTKHVTDQNWFAVFLDFFIVVVGVYIGIEVANWNETRKDGIREEEILADLLEDLEADKASLSRSLKVNTLGIEAGNILLQQAGLEPIQSVTVSRQVDVLTSNVIEVEVPPKSNEALRGELWKYSISRIFPSHNNATIESLIAAGNSSIIKNSSLVRDLQRYRTFWAGVESAQIHTFRPIRDRALFVGQEHGFSPLSPIDDDALADAFRKDPALQGALKTMLEYTIVHRDWMYQLQQQSDTFAKRIEAELKK